MKSIVVSILFSMCSMVAFAQDAGVEFVPPGPHIKFKNSSYDFGDITQGEKVEYTFEFTNDGDAPVIISNVLTTCGCTASSWPKEPITPGQSSKIEVTFNSTGKIGHQNKVITVMSNASNNPERVKIVTNILPRTEG